MSDIKVKVCPFLGLVPCVGEECINFGWDCGEGYCRYFHDYTNHEKRKEGEAE